MKKIIILLAGVSLMTSALAGDSPSEVYNTVQTLEGVIHPYAYCQAQVNTNQPPVPSLEEMTVAVKYKLAGAIQAGNSKAAQEYASTLELLQVSSYLEPFTAASGFVKKQFGPQLESLPALVAASMPMIFDQRAKSPTQLAVFNWLTATNLQQACAAAAAIPAAKAKEEAAWAAQKAKEDAAWAAQKEKVEKAPSSRGF